MSISHAIRDRLRDRRPFHDRVEHFVGSDNGITVSCDITDAESLGMALAQVKLTEVNQTLWSTDQLSSLGKYLCGQVTYLTEPLAAIEFDEKSGSLLLRSKSPRVVGDEIRYFEILASAKRSAILNRYSFNRKRRTRSVVPFTLTNDQFELLLDDLVRGANVCRE